MKLKLTFLALFLSMMSVVRAQVRVQFDISTDTIVCEGEAALLRWTSQNATGVSLYIPSYMPTPDTLGIDSAIFRLSAGTWKAELRAFDNMGNRDSAVKYIRVLTDPKANFNISPGRWNNEYCIGTELQVDYWSGFTGFDSLLWKFGDGATSRERYPKHTYTSPGTFTWELTAWGSCGTASEHKQVTIKNDISAIPELSVYAGSGYACPGSEVYISSSVELADSVRLFTGDGKSTRLEDLTYTYNTPGVYMIKAQAWNQCGMAEATTSLVVSDSFDNQPSMYIYPTDVCPNQAVNFSFGGIDVVSIRLITGDGASYDLDDENGLYQTHKYSTTGTFEVWTEFTYACGIKDTLTENIVVGSGTAPWPMYIYSSPAQACPGQEVQFSGFYMSEGDSLWVDFGDGNTSVLSWPSNTSGARHTFNNRGTYEVVVKRITACGYRDSASMMFEVGNGESNAYLELRVNYNNHEIPFCLNDSLYVSMMTMGSSPLINPKIRFHDRTVNGMEAYTAYSNQGTYLITAEAEDVCGNRLSGAYTVKIVNHTFTPALSYWFHPLAACPYDEFFFDVFTDYGTKVRWDFGDGNSMDHPSGIPHVMHAYDKAGNYLVQVTATNGCGSTATSSRVHVVEAPQMSFTVNSQNLKVNDTLRLNNTTTGYVNAFWVFNYDLEDILQGTSVERIYNTQGTYYVTLFAENEFGCWDTLTRKIQVGVSNVKNMEGYEVFRMYPNPANNKLFVEITGAEKCLSADFLDMNGKVLRSVKLDPMQSKQEISTSELASGMYLIRVYTEQSAYTGRLVLIH